MKVYFKYLLAVVVITLELSCKSNDKQVDSPKPNVVLILVDDMGYSDLGAYGSEIRTPHIDALANNGVVFSEFYNVGICAPTRASLLTGQYQHDAGVGYFNINLGVPSYQGYLAENTVTIAEALKTNGYATFLAGKWHVGSDSLYWPIQRGFDQFYGFIEGASVYFNHLPHAEKPTPLIENNERIVAEEEDFYLTNAISQKANDFISGNKNSGKPFFLYLAYNAPHWPLQALPKDIAKYKGVYDIGWDSLRNLRYKKLIENGIIKEGHSLGERPSTIPAWNTLSADEQRTWAARMEVHAAMLDRVDQNIGKLIAHLKQNGQYENTVFFFLSDNGAAGENVSRVFADWGQLPGPKNATELGGPDSYESITHRWAYAINTPFSYWKTFPYEGGINTPFIASFPAKWKHRKVVGRGHIIDVLPTILELSGTAYPKQYNEKDILPAAGRSLLPVFKGKRAINHDTLYFERGGNKAVRAGKWKLLKLNGDANWRLFDMELDPAEVHDLSSREHDRVQGLINSHQDWEKNHQVLNTDSLLKAAETAKSMLKFEEGVAETVKMN
ncbi:arylsulfatase [Olivibacter sp. SDN3]|uniref:arylsulfatase n=1 Tax=Olivibacter sp. SDN3 TaxID=2764720 RepID=UPI0016510006|nr:arylsulfatase [Olivibacter sp. SDN3]QNL50219.1 arylsulfatase [Olivibacter sp. SDN3]